MSKALTKRKIFAQNAKNVHENLVVSSKMCNFAVVNPSLRITQYPVWVDCACLFPANRIQIRKSLKKIYNDEEVQF